MYFAETGFISLVTNVTFHIRRTVTKHEIQRILFQFTLNETKGAFIIGIYCVIKRDGV